MTSPKKHGSRNHKVVLDSLEALLAHMNPNRWATRSSSYLYDDDDFEAYEDLVLVLPMTGLDQCEAETLEAHIRYYIGGAILKDFKVSFQASLPECKLNFTELVISESEYLQDLRTLWLADAFQDAVVFYNMLPKIPLDFDNRVPLSLRIGGSRLRPKYATGHVRPWHRELIQY
ncbi:hypothetical protein SAMD00019534_048520 [Acytostelium subglobosum LB1]|uniref:hypothetical protein n=1 Tax=Acytostelium subglobosum LB1 TaxID=1410327 RepID=UPI0006448C13|nr:hypothetical protein SAMD00019534_048520 [Acytostelium subglobosum LB1]GAM21677.1 hypothetical protein SAMD00019534_048520 [Acytostelium subglobosum LB1]|eukprot:XP_012755796.1 hypothetical protein SAMD00019534_048520 [Acytostelium subglobosum LB1]